jgi:hypothetical protein
LDDPRIKRLQELLEQATRLRDRTNKLIADLAKGLAPPINRDASAEPERYRSDHSSRPKTLKNH